MEDIASLSVLGEVDMISDSCSNGTVGGAVADPNLK